MTSSRTVRGLLLHTVGFLSVARLTAGYITTPISRSSQVGSNIAFTRIANVINRYNNNEKNTKNQQQQRQSVLYSSSQSNEEWHPSDPASTTPQLLSSLWLQIAQGCKKLSKGESSTVKYPNMQEEFTQSYMERLTGHLDVCKDVCDDFGVNTILSPYTEEIMGRRIITGFTVKSYIDKNKVGTLVSDGNFRFAPDPMWDDGSWDTLEDQIRQAAIEEEEMYDNDEGLEDDNLSDLPEIENKVPGSDDTLIEITKKWVNKLMSDMGVCPFTSGAEMAGLPMGKVYYTVDRCSSMEDMYASYWKEVVRVEQTNEKELSTTLLIAPEFCLDNIELFDTFSNSLTHPLEALQIEDLLQLVFFHPEWTFRDGGDRSGMGSSANYARRSPWPMINILRTKQVRAAQKGIPTGLVYQQNEKTLTKIGTKSLEKMLRLRDWSDIADLKVDRKDLEALRVAQDLQTTGSVADEDTSVVYDSTPAANKVDRAEIEGGNIANVILQALEKRLAGGEDGNGAYLSGAETSVAMMASEFLLEHLDELELLPPKKVIPQNAMAQRYFDLEDDFSPDKVTEEDEDNILFGGGGIKMSSDEDEHFSAGMDPASFH